MCDQDHFEEGPAGVRSSRSGDTKTIRRHVGSRRRHDAAASRQRGYRDRIGGERDDAGRHRGLLLRASGERHSSRRSRVAGHLRTAAGVPADGQTARRIGIFGAGGESVLPRQESSDCGSRRRNSDPGTDAARASAERDDADDGCESVHRVAGRAGVGRQESEGRARRAIAWAVRLRFVPRLPCPIASERWRHSMAADS